MRRQMRHQRRRMLEADPLLRDESVPMAERYRTLVYRYGAMGVADPADPFGLFTAQEVLWSHVCV